MRSGGGGASVRPVKRGAQFSVGTVQHAEQRAVALERAFCGRCFGAVSDLLTTGVLAALAASPKKSVAAL